MKYVILSLRSMGKKLYIMLFVLVISFYILLLFYGESVRNHHFVMSTMRFSAQEMGSGVLTLSQWNAICKTFEDYRGKIEENVYVTMNLCPQGQNIYSSLYYFQGEENSFTKKQYQDCAKIIKTNQQVKEVQIGSTRLTAQQWDSGYSEIPITTVAKEQLPVWNFAIVCGSMSGRDYKTLANRLQKILPDYSCSVDQIHQVLKIERQKTYLFVVAVLVSVFNIGLIYQYIMQEQRYHTIVYRLCGCQKRQLYFISLMESMVFFVSSFALAAGVYFCTYSGMYRLGMVSLKNSLGISYVGTAAILCGVVTILLLVLCSAGTIRKPIKDLYVEGV